MIIGFLGAGVMARALAQGLVKGGVARANELFCSAPTPGEGQSFLDAFPGARWTADNSDVMKAAGITILAIKPQVFPQALAALKPVSKDKLVLSIAAGMTLAKIRGWLDPSARVVRVMPNTPMQIGQGASAYAGDAGVTASDYELVQRILASSGLAWRVEENQIDAVTALSGSGPAYVFHFIEALTRGGAALGLAPDLALALARQTVLGSAQLAAQSSLAPLELARQVKSPGGTTLAGCAVLEENDALDTLFARCLAAARDRAHELAGGGK